MFKWLIKIILGVSLSLLALPPISVMAGDPTVTITVSGWVLGTPSMPTDFVAVFVNPHQVDLTWVKGASANKTMVRAKFGEYPQSKEDGYQVYFDTGNSFSDNSPDLDVTFGAIKYRAWSENVSKWSIDYAEAAVENPSMIDIVAQLLIFNNTLIWGLASIIFFILLAFALWRNSWFLYIISAIGAMILGLSLAGSHSIGTALWVEGVIIVIFGLSMPLKMAVATLLHKGDKI